MAATAEPDLTDVVRVLAPELLSYFVRRVDDPADAADLLQETLVVVCRKPHDVPTGTQEQRMWCYGIARRVLADHRRSRTRRSALHMKLRRELAIGVQPAPAHDELHTALEQLDELDREIVRLIHWEGLRQTEVATVLGMPAATVRSRYLRARAALKSLMAPATPTGAH